MAEAQGTFDGPTDSELTAAGRNRKPLIAYYFFGRRALSGQTFTIEELSEETGWKGQTPKTYLTKQWEALIVDDGSGNFRVKPEFSRMSKEQFLRRFSQKKPVYSEYGRKLFRSIVVYEFLLPLTRETQLRESLDELFYLDHLQRRIRELGLSQIAEFVDRPAGMSDPEFEAHVSSIIGNLFGGYSIAHVSGRFRAADLSTRAKAGDMLAMGDRYIVDETTASVRFIIPCDSSEASFGPSIAKITSLIHAPTLTEITDVEEQIGTIRGLFFLFFVEAIVKIVQGEDQIWLIETTSRGPRLFVWVKEN